MRHPALACLACAAALLAAHPAPAQQPTTVRARVEQVKIGFQGGAQEEPLGTFKPGLWTPIHVTLVVSPDGNITLPVRLDGSIEGEIRVEATDSDDLPNVYPEPFRIRRDPRQQQQRFTLTAYVKPSAREPRIKVTLHTGSGQSPERWLDSISGLKLNEHLYLTLGSSVRDLHKALLGLSKHPPEDKDPSPRHATYETDVDRLPRRWLGYDGVDLLLLTTNNRAFLDDLLRTENRPRVEALAEWVRRGGRLVVSVAWKNQEKVRELLTAPTAWQPALPDVLPAGGQSTLRNLAAVQTWVDQTANVRLKPFKLDENGMRVATLNPHAATEVELAEGNAMPLLVRMPYGLGSVTLLALDVEAAPFTSWPGRVDFWKAVVARFAPKVGGKEAQDDPAQGRVGGDQIGSDLTTRLHQELDRFDSPPISFGWVAVFILLYIVVVGPLDYLLLKKVFKRLELTWITFPAVVLTISLAAYFTAYAVKGKDLKINKIDLIDVDLRSDLDEAGRPRKAYAYGNTWFTILSPRIQSYTVGIDPVFPRLVGDGNEQTAAFVSWLGRPEGGGVGSSGRMRSQGLFTRTYEYVTHHAAKEGEAGGGREAGGLKNVMIPVWSTKSFTASWKAPLKNPPFEADLVYDPVDKANRPLTGTIKSNLPGHIRLEDLRLLYGNKWIRIPGELVRGAPLKISLNPLEKGLDRSGWVNEPREDIADRDPEANTPSGVYNPGAPLRRLLFHEWSDPRMVSRNNGQRRLDESWRLPADWRRDLEIGDAILVGRLPRVRGSAEALTDDADKGLPTHLWLGAIPGGDDARPGLSGQMVQDTYIRIFLPVTPAKR